MRGHKPNIGSKVVRGGEKGDMRAEGARGAKSSHGSQGDRKRRFGLQGSSYGGDLGAARDSLRSEEFGRSLMGAGEARAWGHM